MNRLTALIDSDPQLRGVSLDIDKFLGTSSMEWINFCAKNAWYPKLNVGGHSSDPAWRDFHLALLDLIAEIDDDDLDALIAEYCNL